MVLHVFDTIVHKAKFTIAQYRFTMKHYEKFHRYNIVNLSEFHDEKL